MVVGKAHAKSGDSAPDLSDRPLTAGRMVVGKTGP